MKATLIFPCILIIMDIAAALVYAMHRDWWMVGYWAGSRYNYLCGL